LSAERTLAMATLCHSTRRAAKAYFPTGHRHRRTHVELSLARRVDECAGAGVDGGTQHFATAREHCQQVDEPTVLLAETGMEEVVAAPVHHCPRRLRQGNHGASGYASPLLVARQALSGGRGLGARRRHRRFPAMGGWRDLRGFDPRQARQKQAR